MIANQSTLETDQTRPDSIIRNLQRACEASIDLALHVSRKHRLGLPQDARDGFTLLEQAGLIPVAIANQMRAMVGFRNVAVHQYQQPGIPVLCSTLDHRLGGFTAFTAGVIRANVAT